MGKQRVRIGILGAGRVGTAIGLALSRNKLGPSVVISRTAAPARRLAKLTGCGTYGIDPKLLSSCDLVLVCVPDDAIRATAQSLVGIRYEAKAVIIAHTSGSRTSHELEAARDSKTTILPMSAHPLQTFTSRDHGVDLIKGIYFALEGSPKAVSRMRKLVRSLGAKSIILRADDKVRYHTGAVMASNFLVGLMFSVQCALKQIRISEKDALRMMMPMVSQTLSNVARLGTRRALTGPAARKDTTTIRTHQKSLETAPSEIRSLYKVMTAICLKLSQSKGGL